MIHFLRGAVAHVLPAKAVIDVHGVGYLVMVPEPLSDQLRVGQEVLLHTQLVVREDAFLLFGFAHPDQRELFNLLTSVSGIGAKTALALLSSMNLPDLIAAVVGGRPKELARAPGVGLKTAERLIVELKGKLSDWTPELPPPAGGGGDQEEAMVALLALGYTSEEAREALERLPADLSEDEALRKALLWLSKEV